MSKNNNIGKKSWIGLLIILAILLILSFLVLGKATTLKGAQAVKAKPNFSIDGWFNGTYQKKFEKSASSNFAFYEPMVKMHNQWDYHVWNRANAHDVVFGENNYLFEQSYIDGLYGKGIIEKRNKLNSKKSAIKYVDSEMTDRGNTLVFLLMPSKAFFHPNEIPLSQQKEISSQQIHEDFLTFAEAEKLNVIDFQDYFLKVEDEVPYPIFPKHGIHISEYVETLVLDSLLKFIEAEQGVDLYDYHYDTLIETTEPIRRDNDIAQALNMMKPLPNEEVLAYRNFVFDRREKEDEPNVLVIGDSFYWGIYPRLSRHRLFKRHEFWYRNGQIFSPGIKQKRFSNKAACVESLDGFDITFVMVTVNAVDHAGWGYFNTIYEQRNHKVESPEALRKISQIINNIKNDPKHLNLVKEKAVEQNIGLDSMLYLDAKWLYERGH